MGSDDATILDHIAAARRRLRERTLPTLSAALILQIRVATASGSYDLRALSSALGLLVLVFLAIIGAALDAVVTAFAVAAVEITRVRVRFGPAPAPIVVMPPAISEDMLLDKRGRPLRGAPRTRRLAALERERAQQIAFAASAAAAAASAARVIQIPAPPAPLVAALGRARAFARDAWRQAGRVGSTVASLVPSIPVPTLPLRWVRIVAVTTTMTFVFATALGTTGLITQQGRIALGASTTLTIIAGDVSARTAEGSDFQAVGDGTQLRAGMTIRTGEASYAVLTYFEGSTVSLEPNTTLVIEALEANPDGSTIISMQQQVGRTWHSVAKLLNPSSKYEVKTPTLTATVRGTAFEVGVEQDQTGELVSSIVTTEGAVGAAKPPTPAEPAPAEVIVPAGFQASAKATEPVAPPEPAPEPERKVTVTIGTSNAVVVDPQGRANGERDGKLVLQTPGAKVQKVDGKLVVTLPKVSDGKISTVIAPATGQTTSGQTPAAVSVTTVVSELGRGEARSEETVQVPATPTSPASVTGVEVKRSDSAQPAEVRVLAPAEKVDAPAPKVAEPPKAPESPKPSLLPAPEKTDDEKKDEARGKVSSVVDVFVKATLPPVSIEDPAKRAEEAKKAEERAKEEAAKREEERRRENEQRAEDARRAEQRAKAEAARLAEERERAEAQARRSPASTPAPQGGGFVQNILTAIAPGADESARRDAERRAEEARRAEDKAKEEASKRGDDRRKAEDVTRQDELKRAEEQRKAAEQKAEELRKAEEKAKQDAAKEIERSREIEAKAREQAQRLESEKRREAERLLDEFRKAEEKARADAAKQLEEQRRAEERAKADAERRIEELRRAQERSREEAARAAEERRREGERKAEENTREQRNRSNFMPVQTIDPLPGMLGNDRDRGRSGR